MSKKPTLDQKSKYVTDLINEQKGLKRDDNLAYQYIYDMVTFMIRRKTENQALPSDIPEELIQNIASQIAIQFQIDNNPGELHSMFAYIGKCVATELCKLTRNKYRGKIISTVGFELETHEDFTGYFTTSHTYEMETILHIEKMVNVLIKEIKYLLEENPILVENKNLLFFPLLLAVSREEQRIINKMPLRARLGLKQLYKDIGSPFDRIR